MEQQAFFGCFVMLGLTILLTNFVLIKVPIQMFLYTMPTIYIGSHLSLKLKEIDATTGERSYKPENVTRKDALLFPVIGSTALMSLYVAYKFLPAYFVNLLLTTYLTVIGVFAVAESFLVCVEKMAPASCHAMIFNWSFQLPSILANADGPYDIKASGNQIISYLVSFVLALLWIFTKHWTLHNILAVGFSIQAIRFISVGSFSIASILLCGLFVYDIFWVFGTEVMVTVAKSFEGPAKIIFPTSFNPWKESILGLGDIVIPGILIAMILRFDSWMCEEALKLEKDKTNGTCASLQENVDIHEKFTKVYFTFNLIAYEAGLFVTAAVMFALNKPQPALLYLVPFCLAALYIPVWLRGDISKLLHYSEAEDEEESKKADKGSKSSDEVSTDAAVTDDPIGDKTNDSKSEMRRRVAASS